MKEEEELLQGYAMIQVAMGEGDPEVLQHSYEQLEGMLELLDWILEHEEEFKL